MRWFTEDEVRKLAHYDQLEAELREKDAEIGKLRKLTSALMDGVNKDLIHERNVAQSQRDSARAWGRRWKAFAKWSGGRITFLEQVRQRCDVEKENEEMIRKLNRANSTAKTYRHIAETAERAEHYLRAERDRYKAALLRVYDQIAHGDEEHRSWLRKKCHELLKQAGYNLDSSENGK